MQWKLSEEQADYREALTAWLASTAPAPVRREWFESGEPASFEKLLISGGWAGVGLAEEFGGQGGGMVELALTAECLAGAAVSSSAWFATRLAAEPLLREQAVAGELVESLSATLVVSAESIPDATPTVVADSAGRLVGSVERVLAAPRASVLIVPAIQDGRTTLWWVDAKDVEVRTRRLLDRTRTAGDVSFNGIVARRIDVDAESVLARVAAMSAVLVAADTLGTTQAMLDLSIEYAGQRRQFGAPIGSFQAVKHAAATMLVGIEAARSIVYFAAASVEARTRDHFWHAAAAKAQVTAEGVRTAESALTIHGAIGYTWEHDLHLYFKRAKLNRALGGTPEKWNERIASHLSLGGSGA